MKNIFILILSFAMIISKGQESIHELVDSFILAKDFEIAEKIALEAVNKDSNNTEALCALACVYRNKSYKETISVNFTDHIKDGESGSIGLTEENLKSIFQSKYYFEDSLFSMAESLYFKIIEIDKNYYNAYFNLLNSYAENDDYIKYFTVIDLFTENLKSENSTKEYLLDLASKLYQKQKMDEALKLYNHIIYNYPDYAPAVADLGAVYYNQANYNEALDLLSKAFEIDNKDTLTINNLVNIYIIIEDYENAFKYSKILIENSKSYFNIYTAGILSLLLGNNQQKEYLESFVERHKKKIPAKNLDQDFWYFTANQLLEKKVNIKAIENVVYEFYRNQYHFDVIVIGNYILKNDENNSLAYQVLASTYEKLNYNSKVIDLLKQIESKNSDEKIMTKDNLMYNFGRNYFIIKNYDTAIQYLLKVQNENLTVPLNYLLGESYYFKGNYDKAKEYYSINKKLDDKNNMYYINQSIRRLKELE